jgi:hypothetical protein
MDHLGPDTKQANWRDLFNALREYEGDRWSDEPIRPWTDRHPDTLRELVASRSRMYWSWWSRNRVATDLSHGWGGNSQWGTDFRRDYIADGDLHYNVDGDRTIGNGNGNGDLPAAIAREVIRFRCHLLHDEEELFPFRHRLCEHYRPALNPKEKA